MGGEDVGGAGCVKLRIGADARVQVKPHREKSGASSIV